MGIFLRLAATAGLLFVASCQTYPYASSFSACDSGAGACYRACEAYADDGDGYAACHADCEYEADRCFANAYEPYRYAGSPYGPTYVSPWYGSYGAWYPQAGYTISLGYLSSSRYGYSRPGYRSGSPRYDERRHRWSDPDRSRSDRGRRQDQRGAPPRASGPRYGDRDRGPRGGGRASGGEGTVQPQPSNNAPTAAPPRVSPPRSAAPTPSQDSEVRSPVKERSQPSRPQ